MKHFIYIAVIIFLFASCQKEIIDATVTGGGSGGTGSSNGDLFVRGLSITGTDTTTINLTWDSNKRLIQYLSSGKTNGVVTDSRTDYIRQSNGNITKIFSLPIGAAGFIDSMVAYPVYQSGTSKLSYLINNNYSSLLGVFKDSILYTYNAAGKISSRETYSENFLTGVFEKRAKSNYTYDAPGNLITHILSSPDASGVYTTATTITNTYDSHLAAATYGDEAFTIGTSSEESVSVNNLTLQIQQSSGNTTTLTESQQQFNSYNRPTSGQISITPVPPGYTLKYIYFYQ